MVEKFEHQYEDSYPIIGTVSEHAELVPELYLRAFVDSHSTGVAVLNGSGTILYVNRAWREFALQHGLHANLYGIGSNYLNVRRTTLDTSIDESHLIADGIDEVLVGKATEFQHEYLNRNSIDRRWIRVHAGRFDLPRACRVLVTHEDVTESRQTTETRQKAAEHLRRLLDATHILPWEADFSTSMYTYVGEQAVDILGYPLEDWYEPDFWPKHLHPADRERAMATATRYIQTRNNYELEFRMLARGGRIVWLHNIVTVDREDGIPRTVRGFSIDITESKVKEAALSELSGRLINAQEEERRRVARELHDDLNQRMALLSIEMEQLGQAIKPRALRRRLESLQSQAREISADIHRLSYKLHPSKLDHLGLGAAIRSLCQELSEAGQLDVELTQDELPELPKDITLCVFRIAQEALRNSVKHSGAKTARVTLGYQDHEITLSVSDDGSGFDMYSDAMRRGLGFTSMRERLRIVNGTMNVQSRPNEGTTIKVSVPLLPKSTVAAAQSVALFHGRHS